MNLERFSPSLYRFEDFIDNFCAGCNCCLNSHVVDIHIKWNRNFECHEIICSTCLSKIYDYDKNLISDMRIKKNKWEEFIESNQFKEFVGDIKYEKIVQRVRQLMNNNELYFAQKKYDYDGFLLYLDELEFDMNDNYFKYDEDDGFNIIHNFNEKKFNDEEEKFVKLLKMNKVKDDAKHNILISVMDMLSEIKNKD